MKAMILALLAMGCAATAMASTDPQFTIQKMTVREVPSFSTSGLNATRGDMAIGAVGCEQSVSSMNGSGLVKPNQTPPSMNPLDTVDMIVDKIINIGKKIFAIVQAGKPVVNMKTDIATALPSGARCWLDLAGWQAPDSKVYEVSFENGFGAEVVKMAYRVVWIHGGNVDGAGQYIGYATMSPVSIEVSWGFSLNAAVTVPSVFNMGTKSNPVAGMQMNMQYQIESPVSTIQEAQAFFVDGKGSFKQLD